VLCKVLNFHIFIIFVDEHWT